MNPRSLSAAETGDEFVEVEALLDDIVESTSKAKTTNTEVTNVLLRSLIRKHEQTDQVMNGLYDATTSALTQFSKLQDRIQQLELIEVPENNGSSNVDATFNEDDQNEIEDFYNLADCALGFFADEILSLQSTVEQDRKEAVVKKKELDVLLKKTIDDYESAQHDMRCDGQLVWRIPSFPELRLDHGQSSIYSNRFQTPDGFEFRLRLFPNGAGKGRGSHISLFVQMCRTDNDPVLPYPFEGLCIITLFDQNTTRGKKEHFTVKFKTNNSDCFSRPVREFNPENGVAQFVSHEMIKSHTNNNDTSGSRPIYMHRGTIFVGADIRFTNNLNKMFRSPGDSPGDDKHKKGSKGGTSGSSGSTVHLLSNDDSSMSVD